MIKEGSLPQQGSTGNCKHQTKAKHVVPSFNPLLPNAILPLFPCLYQAVNNLRLVLTRSEIITLQQTHISVLLFDAV
jgi:hypothetical protein